MGLRSTGRKKRRYAGVAANTEGPLVLCVDTAGDWLTLALQKGDTLLAHHSSLQRHSHARAVLPLIDAMLVAHRCTLDQVDVFGVCVGPGSFTGLRVGIVTVKSLAFAHKTPCVAVSSTELLAATVEHDGALACAIDARKGEAYFALYDRGSEGRTLLIEPLCDKPAAGLARILERVEGPVLLVGSAGVAYKEELRETGGDRIRFAPADTAIPSPRVLARLCMEAFLAGNTMPSATLEPMYVRPPSITVRTTTS